MNEEKENEKFFTKKDKILGKIFLLLFLFVLIIVNWSGVSVFVFNLQALPVVLEERKEEGPEEKENDREPEKKENDIEKECFENRIEVSILSISAPIVEPQGTSERDYRNALDRGVVRFPDSHLPGEKGLVVLLGHSSPPGWPDIRYDRIFTEIDQLKEGDIIEICYDESLYKYTVVDEEKGKDLYSVGDDVPSLYPGENKKELVLMTCWPPGDDTGRMGVRAIGH